MQASSRGVEWGVAWESPDKEVTMQNCAVAAPSFMPSGYSFTLDARRSTMPSWSLGLSQSYFPLLYTHTLALARIREMSNCLAVSSATCMLRCINASLWIRRSASTPGRARRRPSGPTRRLMISHAGGERVTRIVRHFVALATHLGPPSREPSYFEGAIILRGSHHVQGIY